MQLGICRVASSRKIKTSMQAILSDRLKWIDDQVLRRRNVDLSQQGTVASRTCLLPGRVDDIVTPFMAHKWTTWRHPDAEDMVRLHEVIDIENDAIERVS